MIMNLCLELSNHIYKTDKNNGINNPLNLSLFGINDVELKTCLNSKKAVVSKVFSKISSKKIFNFKLKEKSLKISKLLSKPEFTNQDRHFVKNYLLKSLSLKPYNELLWICLAKIELNHMNIKSATYYLMLGLEFFPYSTTIWILLLTYSIGELTTSFFLKDINILPVSARFFISLIDKIDDINIKKFLLYRSISRISNNKLLWVNILEIEDIKYLKKLLYRAIECCPNINLFWNSLINLSNYKDSRRVLNLARFLNPQSKFIWVEAAKLEESYGFFTKISNIITRCFKIYRIAKRALYLKTWLTVTESLEHTLNIFKFTLKSILKLLMILDLARNRFLIYWLNMFIILKSHNSILNSEEVLKNLSIIFDKSMFLAIRLLILYYQTKKDSRFICCLRRFVTNLRYSEIFLILYLKFSFVHICTKTNFSVNPFIINGFCYSANIIKIIIKLILAKKDLKKIILVTYLIKKKKCFGINIITSFLNFKESLVSTKIGISNHSDNISFDNKCNLKNNSNIYLYILENFFNTKVFFAIFKSMVFFENVLYKLFILTNLFLHDRINPRILIKKMVERDNKPETSLYCYITSLKSQKNRYYDVFQIIVKYISNNRKSSYLWSELVKASYNRMNKYLLFYAFMFCTQKYLIFAVLSKIFFLKGNFNSMRNLTSKALMFNGIYFDNFLDTILVEESIRSIGNIKFLVNVLKNCIPFYFGFYQTIVMNYVFKNINLIQIVLVFSNSIKVN